MFAIDGAWRLLKLIDLFQQRRYQYLLSILCRPPSQP